MKHTCIMLLAALLICQQSVAQLSFKKQADGGGSGNDQLVNLLLAKDGGAVAAGSSASNHSFYKSSDNWNNSSYITYSNDYWIVKASKQQQSNGSFEQWDKTIGGSGDDRLQAAIVTGDGGYLLAGISQSGISGNKTAPHYGAAYNYNTWVVKLDANGDMQWDKTYDTTDIFGNAEVSDGINAVAQTTDDGYIFLCNRFVEGYFTNVSKLIKTDAQGNVLWQIDSINFKGYGYPTDLKVTADGGYILGGGISYPENIFPFGPARLVKTDSAANIEWTNLYTINHGNFLSLHVKTTSDGGYVLYGTDDISNMNVIKTDNTGKLQWDDTISIGHNDYDGYATRPFSALTETTDQGFLIGYSRQTAYNGPTVDVHVDKISAGGQLLWKQVILTTYIYDTRVDDFLTTGPNQYLLGLTTSAGIGGYKTVPNLGSLDYWVIYAKDTTNTASPAPLTAKIASPQIITTKAYPNPANDVLHIRATGKANITLTDAMGKILLNKSINSNENINVSKFPPGIYYLINKTEGTTQKIVIER